jgi:hypothetical protein
LQVHPYTFRNEARPYLAWNWAADPWAELYAFFGEEGVDGVFTDHPDSGVKFLARKSGGHTETLKIKTKPDSAHHHVFSTLHATIQSHAHRIAVLGKYTIKG